MYTRSVDVDALQPYPPTDCISVKDKLPWTLHELLLVAVADVRLAIKDKNLTVDMGDWITSFYKPHSAKKGKYCSVCMAGAVIHNRLIPKKAQFTVTARPMNFDDPVQRKLEAINNMRVGDFIDAFDDLYEARDWARMRELKLTDKRQKAIGDASTLVIKNYPHDYDPTSDGDTCVLGARGGHAPLEVYEQAAAILKKAGL